MTLPDDREIIDLILLDRNKDQGFRMLVNKYKERIYWHVRRMVGNHEDADDICQEVFIKIFKNLSSYKGDAALFTWIYRISLNECLGFLRKRKWSHVELEQSEVSRWSTDRYFNGEDALKLLWDAILELPPKQRAVFELRYFEEMPYKEMATIFETSEGALKASYHHATNKIEQYIKRNEGGI